MLITCGNFGNLLTLSRQANSKSDSKLIPGKKLPLPQEGRVRQKLAYFF